MILATEAVQEASRRGYKISNVGFCISPSGKTLSNNLKDRKQYKYFNIKLNGGVVKVYFHRLQAFQKFGNKIFNEKIQVRHLDGNSLNNSWDNIEIGSQSDNMMDKPISLRVNASKKAVAALRKLSNEEVKNIRKDRKQGYKFEFLMKKYGIAKSTVSDVINHKTYKEI